MAEEFTLTLVGRYRKPCRTPRWRKSSQRSRPFERNWKRSRRAINLWIKKTSRSFEACRINGKVSGLLTDYHYYGTGDVGGAPDEESVKRLEAMVTKGTASLPPLGSFYFPRQSHPEWPQVKVGEGPVHVLSATADQMFLNITPSEAAGL